jgi:hypothetical protein
VREHFDAKWSPMAIEHSGTTKRSRVFHETRGRSFLATHLREGSAKAQSPDENSRWIGDGVLKTSHTLAFWNEYFLGA